MSFLKIQNLDISYKTRKETIYYLKIRVKSRGKKIWVIRKMPLNLTPYCPMV